MSSLSLSSEIFFLVWLLLEKALTVWRIKWLASYSLWLKLHFDHKTREKAAPNHFMDISKPLGSRCFR